MSRLADELRKDPGAVFGFEVDLPSGNRLSGVVGPMVGDNVVAHLRFRSEPSESDVATARAVIDQAMGASPELSRISRTPEERAEAMQAARRFLGGGQG